MAAETSAVADVDAVATITTEETAAAAGTAVTSVVTTITAGTTSAEETGAVSAVAIGVVSAVEIGVDSAAGGSAAMTAINSTAAAVNTKEMIIEEIEITRATTGESSLPTSKIENIIVKLYTISRKLNGICL